MPKTGILETLSAEQKDQLFHWIEESCPEAIRKVAAPPPEGFGIQTHLTSLRRFYQREKMRRLAENLPVAVANLPRPEDLRSMQAAMASVLLQSGFEMVTTGKLTKSEWFAFIRALRSLRELEIRSDHLELAREQLETKRQMLQMSVVFKKLEYYYPAECMEMLDHAVAQICGTVPIAPSPKRRPGNPEQEAEDEHTKTQKNTLAQLHRSIMGR